MNSSGLPRTAPGTFNDNRTLEDEEHTYRCYANTVRGSDWHRKYKELAKQFSIKFSDDAFDSHGNRLESDVAVYVAECEMEAFKEAVRATSS